MEADDRRQHAVVVGAGFGGLAAARALSRDGLEVTVVDRDNYHGFWPLLYQVATAALSPDDIASPLRPILSPLPGVRVRLGTVTDVDLEGRQVCLEEAAGGVQAIGYDWLVVAAGSATSDFGIPGVYEHAFPLKTLPDAVRLRNHILTAFEQADADPSHVDRGALTVVCIGGGSTGVEMAGALSELIAANLVRDFPHLDLTKSSVVLLEMADHLLGGFAPSSQRNALDVLRAKGVDVRLNTRVAEVEADHVNLTDGTTIPTRTVVWTAGIKANPLAGAFPGDKGPGGAVKVEPDLSLPGHPEVFVIGDMAAATDRRGQPLPQLAQVAIQGGRWVARAIRARREGRPAPAFRYHNHGIMATVGRRDAVAELPGGIRFAGTIGWLAWLGVHLVFIAGFRNRLIVLANWAWNYLTWDRGSRVIVAENDRTPSGQRRA